MSAAWDSGYPASAYGLSEGPGSPVSITPTETSKIPTVSKAMSTAGTLWHKDNPLLVLLVIGAVTIGAASISGSARLGKAKASVELGEQK